MSLTCHACKGETLLYNDITLRAFQPPASLYPAPPTLRLLAYTLPSTGELELPGS